MKKFNILHDGLVYCVTVYAKSKKQAIADYRKQWQLQGKKINLQIWQD